MVREEIYRSIDEERDSQDKKWGDIHVQAPNRTPAEWATILGEEFGESCQEFLRLTFDKENISKHRQNLKEELVQVAAVAVVILEAIEEGYL